ncbi:MAG: thiol:disulfide interchange protein DsbA/DsbL [Pseudomonadota bacterium]
MRLLQHIVSALVLCGLAAFASATSANPQNGIDYLTLPSPQHTDAGNKVEVIEFFAYYCPHCDAFEPILAQWVKKQGDKVVFKRVHVPYNERTIPQQRLFYTLEAMGLTEKYHSQVFKAMHVERLQLSRDEMVFDWIEKVGIDRTRFIDTYRSFGVQAKVRRADAMMEPYGINKWPMIIVDGKYQTSPSQASEGAPPPQTEAQQHQLALQVMDYLVARAATQKK